MPPRPFRAALGAALAASACTHDAIRPASEPHMSPDAVVGDFEADAVYTDDHGRPVGTRWRHKAHGMPVTVLRIQSVPQVFLAFNTPPVSDRGEPHTGEHLLLGKGTKGKLLAAEQDMSLVQSTAYTSQTDVCYSWSCAAGKETFFRSVEQYLDALLLPNYTDEEIRREVCHLGPVKDRATGELSVDEKGTIYQEMVSSYEKRWNVWRASQKRLWGEAHPLSYSSGGEPSAVRRCEPHHVRDFHAAHYHLGADTQMIVALPDSVPEREFLERLSAQMAAVDADPELQARPRSSAPIPPARPQADRSLEIVPYPNANEGDAGMAILAWPPVRLLPQEDRVAGEILLSTLASGTNATLYKRLMDRATREVPVDAAEMDGSLDASKVDLTAGVVFDGVPPRAANEETMSGIVRVVRDEIARVASLPEGSPELAAFNEKALVKLAERERGLRKQLNSPPLFGHRMSGGFWLEHLRLLDMDAGFTRSVTLAPVFEKLRKDLAAGVNPWSRLIGALGMDEMPYASVSVASKAELERRTAEKAERVRGYVAEIAKREGLPPQEALARFAARYEETTAALAEADKDLGKPRLVADVPLVPDPSIRLEPMESAGVPGWRGVFDNMTFVETSLCFDAGASKDELPWLAILPSFLTQAGVVIDGQPVPYDVVAERRAREIHSLTAEWSMRPSRGRRELRVTASGADAEEAARAIDWIERSIRSAWVAPENLARLRDVVSQEIQSTRTRLGGAEERWVRDPAGALRWQHDPVYLATSSAHARLFLLARCEWRLLGSPEEPQWPALRAGFERIASSASGDAKETASKLEALAAGWAQGDAAASRWLAPIASRVKDLVGDMAPGTIARDVGDLLRVCESDLRASGPGAANALASFRALAESTFRRAGARFVLTGSRAGTDAVAPRLAKLLAALPAQRAVRETLETAPLVERRLADHEGPGPRPVHYGLLHGGGTTGVFVLSADAAGYDDTAESALVEELAARVFGGSGAHAFFMKTWGAGLAYSNGTGVNPAEGRANYYAERCPDLVQTMSFVTGLVKEAGTLTDPYLAEYCVANAVTHSRESDQYEARTRAAADDMEDGDTPERVAAWRRAVLALKDREDLWSRIAPRIGPATGRVLPGIDPRSRDVAGGVFLTIAPAPMLERWEEYVREREGASERVVRIYGRDFWPTPR